LFLRNIWLSPYYTALQLRTSPWVRQSLEFFWTDSLKHGTYLNPFLYTKRFM
jgi:hypothetical protein